MLNDLTRISVGLGLIRIDIIKVHQYVYYKHNKIFLQQIMKNLNAKKFEKKNSIHKINAKIFYNKVIILQKKIDSKSFDAKKKIFYQKKQI